MTQVQSEVRHGPVASAELLRKAGVFAHAAHLAMDEDHELAATLAALAGITAADSICCLRLGRRSLPKAHRDAPSLLAQAEPRATEAVRVVDTLVRIGERAAGWSSLTVGEARRAVAHAFRLVDYAERVAFGVGEPVN